jgi:hypothetical protein
MGSEYQNGVSVTQQEYRVAVKLAEQGRIVPIIFIRSTVFTALDERKVLGAVVESDAIDTKASRALEDPEFVRAFVEEVRRTEVGRRGDDPSGYMWTYPFGEFRQLADALRHNLRLYGSIPRQTLLANFEWELRENLTALCGKRGETPLCGHHRLKGLRSSLHLSTDALAGAVSLDPKQANWLGVFLLTGAPEEQLIRNSALHDAISSREFLRYSQEEGRLVRTPELDAMYLLEKQIQAYRSMRAYIRTRQDYLFTETHTAQITRRRANIPGVDLMIVFGLANIMVNIQRLSFALLDYIADPRRGIEAPDLINLTPFGESMEHIKKEQATHDDIEQWRTVQKLRERILN